ncbi:eukaryotic translation initiation factor 3 subunit E [Tilletiaria anomala UBC 951]|uniref:Eukaryotic translation initiation factor 3 subunit E n=1 Tax=Tilletiaria anomala (strain ATCC 24038 / CBS 436.72 / UBC 951) TaxID=1037660 RepID=A0A066WK09_TILAU|nr:eukaryotic translation initiation factor 3 subunit E [Tilletiaria anomala UBC 951]KDN51334.1 eukaryotic translation initiation factor 3 subunit E [Tilletiaria anomala UBC 951]
MAEYDLTPRFLQHVDRHLAIPMLQHLSSTGLFKETDLVKAQYELARGTSMVGYTAELYSQAYPGQQAPPELEKQKEEALATNERLTAEVEHALNVIEDPKVLSSLKSDKQQNLSWLEQNYQLTLDQINALYRFGYFQFNCGNYAEASSYLYHFRIFSMDPAMTLSSYWGKLAADILMGNWDAAMEELKLLRDQVDSGAGGSAVISASGPTTGQSAAMAGVNESLLQKRTWLLHWSLFVYFNHPQGREMLVELFFSPAYLSTVQTSAWWLLRYLVVALVMTRRTTRIFNIAQPGASALGNERGGATQKLSAQNAMKDLVRILNIESYRSEAADPESDDAASSSKAPADPILKFISVLYEGFDFEAAQEELAKAEQLIANDFFLADHKDAFVESARYLISELYCRIHHRVDIADLSRSLNMSKEEGEKWVVNLIRDTRTDAKIDFKENMVYMNQTPQAMYQNIIEKTRGFVFRTSAMGQAIDRKANPSAYSGYAGGDGGRGGAGGRGGRGGAAGRGGRGGGRGGSAQGPGASGRHQQAASSAPTGQDGSAQVNSGTGTAPAASESVEAA